MLPDDDDLIPLPPAADESAAGEGLAGAGDGAGEQVALESLVGLDIVELIPDLGEGSEAGEAVDLSVLFAEDSDDRSDGAVFGIEADDGAGSGDSFAVTFPAAPPGLDDIPGDGGIF